MQVQALRRRPGAPSPSGVALVPSLEALLATSDHVVLAAPATLDVTEPEPLPAGHPLYRHPKVFLSPHTSAISPLQQQELAGRFVENLGRYERGEVLVDVIGAERVARAY